MNENFFNTASVKTSIESLISKLEEMIPENLPIQDATNSQELLSCFIIHALSFFLEDPISTDRAIQYSIYEKITDELSILADNIKPNGIINVAAIELIFRRVYIIAADFSLNEKSARAQKIEILRKDLNHRANDISIKIKKFISCVDIRLPKKIVNTLMELECAKYTDELISKRTDLIKQIDEIKVHKDDVQEIKRSLDEYRIAFNFVKLTRGFRALREKKIRDLDLIHTGLFVFGLFITTALAIQILYAPDLDIKKLPRVIAALAFDAVLLYFFKIFLTNFNQIKTEILQLDLRLTLCEFIQSYVEFSKNLRIDSKDSEKMPIALDKFENLIFSGIMMSQEQMPSTFDGVDKLLAFLKNKNSNPSAG